MNGQTVTAIIMAAFGGLVVAMAGLLKAMVTDKLKAIHSDLSGLRESHDSLKDDLHNIDLRLTRLEVEHEVCIFDKDARR